MNFNHLNRFSVDAAAKRAVEIHGKPDYALNPEELKMRKQTHTGIELTGAELADDRKRVLDEIDTIQKKIDALEISIDEHTAGNEGNAKDELVSLYQRLDFLQNNFGEKLFGEPLNPDEEVSI